MSVPQNTATSIVHGPAAEALQTAQIEGQAQPVSGPGDAPKMASRDDFKTNQGIRRARSFTQSKTVYLCFTSATGGFASQVKGYAREIAGKVFDREEEVDPYCFSTGHVLT
jgi:hypothetical protein